MKWDVKGVEHDGSRVNLVIESQDPADAAAQATNCGMLVTSVSARRKAGGVVVAMTIGGILVILVLLGGIFNGQKPSPRTVGQDPSDLSRSRSEPKTLKELYERSSGSNQMSVPVASADHDSFYNAQRDPPYLTNEVSGHQTRSGAIAALAAQFEESTTWVEANMGSSNSLDQIHGNFVRAKFREAGVQVD